MSQIARVESVDALKEFRVAMIKFAEAANAALGDAEAEVQRAQMWLENDQMQHWTSQIRKRTEIVSRCKEALRMKKVFKDATGSKGSYIDEEKALNKAMAQLQEAEQKLANTKSWARRFQKEAAAYKGSVQRMSTFVLADVPVAVAKLDRMTAALQAYIAFAGPQISNMMAGMGSSSSAPAPAAEPTTLPSEDQTPPGGEAEAGSTPSGEGDSATGQQVAEANASGSAAPEPVTSASDANAVGAGVEPER